MGVCFHFLYVITSRNAENWLCPNNVDPKSLNSHISIDVNKSIFLREKCLTDIDEITKAADVYDSAHQRENEKKKVNNFNSYSTNYNSGANHTATIPPNIGKPSCLICGKRGHTSETCYSKKTQNTEKGPVVCSHCHKSNHTAENCYLLHGKPSNQGKNKNGPQPHSTFKGKTTHPVAAVNVCEPPKHYVVFENSSTNKQNTNEEDMKYSFLQGTDETEVFTSCTIMSINQRDNNKQILNPHSKAKIEGSDEPQTVLRDSGSFVSIIRRDLVPKRCYTNRKISLQFADGNMTTVPTALMRINSNFFSGVMEFGILENPVSPIIIGNMEHVTENFSNRNFGKNISEEAIQQKTGTDSIIHKHQQTEVNQTTNQPKIEVKSGNEQKFGSSLGAKHEKMLNPGKIGIEQNRTINGLNTNSMNNKEQKQSVFENKTMLINTTAVNTETNLNMVSTEHALNNSGNKNLLASGTVPDSEFSPSEIKNKPELTTFIDYEEQSHIPISAVLTRSKARNLDEIKMPNLLLQIPDISPENFKEMQRADKSLERFWRIAQGTITQDEGLKATFMIKKGLLYRKPVRPRGLGDSSETQLVIPSDLKHIVLRTAHESVLGCHMSTKKTTQKIQANFWFEGIVSYTHKYCKSCDVCQKTIKHGKVAKAPMLISKLSDAPFSRISCDLVGPLSPSQNGYMYILTIIDLATRYPDAIPLKRITTGKVADALKEFFFRMGIPDVISTDNGFQFCSKEMEDFFNMFNIKHIRSTPWHPMAQGAIENFNGCLEKCLIRLCEENTKRWDTFISPCLYALRETIHASTGFSPNECVFRKDSEVQR